MSNWRRGPSVDCNPAGQVRVWTTELKKEDKGQPVLVDPATRVGVEVPQDGVKVDSVVTVTGLIRTEDVATVLDSRSSGVAVFTSVER